MARIFVVAISAITILGLGIVSLQYRAEDLNSAGLTNQSAEAFNLTKNVSTGATEIAGNALPRLLLVVLFAFIVLMVLLNRR